MRKALLKTGKRVNLMIRRQTCFVRFCTRTPIKLNPLKTLPCTPASDVDLHRNSLVQGPSRLKRLFVRPGIPICMAV